MERATLVLPRMLLVFLAVTLSFAAASPTQRSVNSDAATTAEPPAPDPLSDLPGEKDNLNDIFREVEDLIRDSNSKLANAVKEMEAEETSADRVALKDLPPNYHNETIKETKLGNDTIVTEEEVLKETDNKTGATFVSRTIVSSLQSGGKREHECIVDEDCGPGSYCHLSDFIYRCLQCKQQEMCSRDGECCDGQLCIWGQCKKSEKGESGAICEKQSDCVPGLCCAVHSNLLFPVCTPLLVRGEECQNSNSLLDIFSWDMESDAPLNRCPCDRGLICQAQSDGLALVCEELPLQSKREDMMQLPFFTPIPQEDIIYEDGIDSPAGIGADFATSEDERDVEFDSEQPFVDYI
ncbi:PREDICTED: dickkopf-related protein 3 [Nanorana parkeri]|uniref:dickkopf-related protein 3 n=1 Tax=Nanorana parkeri TaxID=125878 RepID=UPI0008547BDF|nr:PREDICTED: dickkopf-related protein 3 [Nanorana parkeri]